MLPRRCDCGRAAGESDAADVDRPRQRGIRDRERRRGELQIIQTRDGLVIQIIAVQRGDRDRDRLQILDAPLGGNDNLFELHVTRISRGFDGRRIGRHCCGRTRKAQRQQQP